MDDASSTVRIESFHPGDVDAVVAHILSIQHEHGVSITAEDQPDLRRIPEIYQQGAGDFWVAWDRDRMVGTIALVDTGDGATALRKMMVAPSHRGAPHRLGQRLLEHLLSHARNRGVRDIYLGTVDRLRAAIRFYERNGFQRVEPESLPPSWPRMKVDTHFYRLRLG